MRANFWSIFLRWPSHGFQLDALSLLMSGSLSVFSDRGQGLVAHGSKLKFFQLNRTAESLWVTLWLVCTNERNGRRRTNSLGKSFYNKLQVVHRLRYRFFLLFFLINVEDELGLFNFVLWSCVIEFYLMPKDYRWLDLASRRYTDRLHITRGKGWENYCSLNRLSAKPFRRYVGCFLVLVFFWSNYIRSLEIYSTQFGLTFVSSESWLQLVSLGVWWECRGWRLLLELLLYRKQSHHVWIEVGVSEFWHDFKFLIRAFLINIIIRQWQPLLTNLFFRNKIILLNRSTLLATEIILSGLWVYALSTTAVFTSLRQKLFWGERRLVWTCLLWPHKPNGKTVAFLLY